MAGFPTAVSAQIYFDTAADSRLWLEGSSTVHRFDCVARSIQGTAYMDENNEIFRGDAVDGADKTPVVAAPVQNSGGSDNDMVSGRSVNQATGQAADRITNRAGLHVLLKIPIKSFDCAHSRMNQDMYEALKSDTYDFITFEFENAQPVEKDQSGADKLFADGYEPFLIEGVLSVSGVDRVVTLTVRGRQEEQNRYRIKGEKKISMKDYEIEPPTALMGLIRAHDDLTVFFDLVVVQESS